AGRRVLEAREHLHLGAERLAVELDRLLAATVEEDIRLHDHREPPRREAVLADAPIRAHPSTAKRDVSTAARGGIVRAWNFVLRTPCARVPPARATRSC